MSGDAIRDILKDVLNLETATATTGHTKQRLEDRSSENDAASGKHRQNNSHESWVGDRRRPFSNLDIQPQRAMSGLARPLQRSLRASSCLRCRPSPVRALGLQLPVVTKQYSNAAPRPSNQRAFSLPLALLLVLPAAYYFYPTERANRRLSPQTYSEQQVVATASLSPTHKLLRVAVAPSDRALFGSAAVRRDGTPATGDREVVVQHVMIKSPDLQIERPYTPINDAEADGSMDLVVKRVRGGEVGRCVERD